MISLLNTGGNIYLLGLVIKSQVSPDDYVHVFGIYNVPRHKHELKHFISIQTVNILTLWPLARIAGHSSFQEVSCYIMTSLVHVTAL